MNDNPQSLPADSVHQAARFVHIACIGLLLAVLVAALGMSHFFDWSLGKSVLVVLAAMGAAYIVFFGLFFAKWLYCRSIAGK